MNSLFSTEAITVAALNARARQLLEQNFNSLWVSGEVSNLTRAASGHYYFNLKDEMAQVRCALFKGHAAKLSAPLTEGAQIELTGKITIYEARGEYQISVTDVRFSGLGRLFAAFEKLKAKLQAEGLFDAVNKKPLPTHPRTIGIVTSPAAAAFKDVLTTLRRRIGKLNVILYPTPVQGAMSEHSIARAINIANERGEVDVLIVCRGGGSIEDLWAFNEEVVARAIAASYLPVVSGVGHETDFTIADFVADLRAPTPTAAAELVSFDAQALAKQLLQYQHTLQHFMRRFYENNSQRLDGLSRNLLHPRQQLARQMQQTEQYQIRLRSLMQNLFKEKQYILALRAERLSKPVGLWQSDCQRLSQYKRQLLEAMSAIVQRSKSVLTAESQLLEAIAPQKVLARGYAIVQNQAGQLIQDATQTKPYEPLRIIFARSELQVNVSPENSKQDELPF